MNLQCRLLVAFALRRQASDIHLELCGTKLTLSLRTPDGLQILDQDLFGPALFEHLRYISGMDLCAPGLPQSREFSLQINDQRVDCRFSVMKHDQAVSGVIRLLPYSSRFSLDQLCSSIAAIEQLHQFCQESHGLIIACGPTGSGKSTAIHALLREILAIRPLKIVTLEDPVEIHEDGMVQIEINEAAGLNWGSALSQLLRHDPDVLVIGECRSEYTAKMALRASLTGHLVFTTLHCGSGAECLWRLRDLGVDSDELRTVLKGIFVCSLKTGDHGKEGVYEIWNEQSIPALFENPLQARASLPFEECEKETGRRTDRNMQRRAGDVLHASADRSAL